jgi:hypothetical protein
MMAAVRFGVQISTLVLSLAVVTEGHLNGDAVMTAMVVAIEGRHCCSLVTTASKLTKVQLNC